MYKLLILFLILYTPASIADTIWSSCTEINRIMASENVSDSTGSISQSYDCSNGQVTVIANINPHISYKAVLDSVDSFINNYCLSISKNYLLSNNTDRELLKVLLRGGVKYVIEHNKIERQIKTKTLDECLEYVQIMESQLPENPYEQIKFIRKFTTKN